MVEGRVVDVEKEANLNMYVAECHEEATPVMLFARKPGWLRDNEILFVDSYPGWLPTGSDRLLRQNRRTGTNDGQPGFG